MQTETPVVDSIKVPTPTDSCCGEMDAQGF